MNLCGTSMNLDLKYLVIGIVALCVASFLLGLLAGRRRRDGGSSRSPEVKASSVKSPDLYIGNLPDNTTEDDIRKAFGRFGDVKDVRLIMDRISGSQKGFSFITMGSVDQAQAAVLGMDGHDLDGHKLVVSEARSRRNNRGRR